MADLPKEAREIDLAEVVDETAEAATAKNAAPVPIPIAIPKPPPPVPKDAEKEFLDQPEEIDLGVGESTPVLPMDTAGKEPPPVSAPSQVPAPVAPTIGGRAGGGDWEVSTAEDLLKNLPKGIDLTSGRTVVPPPPMELFQDLPAVPPEGAAEVVIADALSEAAPPLPVGEGEPAPVSGVGIEALKPDAQAVETLKRLAGAAADPESARAALRSALNGEPHNVRALPEPRALALGVARLLTKKGFSNDEIVDAIMSALLE
jgi:hypothetical protein